MFIVTELFNIEVNYFNAKKSARCSRVLVVSELVVSGTQCISKSNAAVRRSFYTVEIHSQSEDPIFIAQNLWKFHWNLKYKTRRIRQKLG